MSRRSAREARRIRIRGRVQGVWFRDSTRREALLLGLKGYAINLESGEVEVLACGPSDALDTLCDWLKHGPPLARVTEIEVAHAEYQDLANFTIG